jgi:hypothetical protein
MSASSDADDIRKSYMLGATSYFVKPTGFEALERLLRLLYEVWLLAELPAVDATGRQIDTNSKGKLGERIPHDSEPSDDVAAADEEYAHVPCAMPARRQRA